MPERPSRGSWSRDEKRHLWATTALVSLKLSAMEIGTDDEIHASLNLIKRRCALASRLERLQTGWPG